jgi:hypothetical protein
MNLLERRSCQAVLRQFTPGMLSALRVGLETNHALLVQGATMSPPVLDVFLDHPLECADAICWAAWKSGEVPDRVGIIADFALRLCARADAGEAGLSHHFVNWFDAAPRGWMRRELLAEILVETGRRAQMKSEAA